MTQEEKELLLKDLCGRLPYKVKVKIPCLQEDIVFTLFPGFVVTKDNGSKFYIPSTIDIYPYLRPMSSMTEEEKKEFIKVSGYDIEESINGRHYEYYLKDSCVGTPNEPTANYDAIDWLNKNHFNYRNLPEHLYIKVTEENNPYKV